VGAEHEPLIQLRRRADAAAAAPLARLVRDIEALEAIVRGWDEGQRNVVRALQTAIDALHREAIVRMIRSLRTEPEMAAALKRAASDEVVYGVLRHHGVLRPSLHERVEEALAAVRPLLATHGGNVELVEVAPPDAVTVRLLGSCDGCAASGLTLRQGVEKAIRDRCPEITTIKTARGASSGGHGAAYVSPFARADDGGWVRAAKLDEVAKGRILVVEVEGRSLLLTRHDEGVGCFDNACAHLGMPLDMGEVTGGVLTCPHHQFRYALDSGECLTAPGVALRAHAVRIEDGVVEVKLS
jgi:nitrite reductase/ring-hydroxylating ferredoxin subunit/Fe-S cluster biogenesis protein NfuA